MRTALLLASLALTACSASIALDEGVTTPSSTAPGSGSGAGAGGAGGAGGTEPALAPHDVRRVALGDGHACALFGDGSIKCWGRNDHGQLGLGDTEDRGDAPGEMGAALPVVDLGAGRRAVDLAAGSASTCAVLEGGQVKCWGQNALGKLGLGDAADRGAQPGEMGDALPAVALGAGARAVAVQVGNYHACALLDDGSVRCWGATPATGIGYQSGDTPATLGDALPPVALGAGRRARALFAAFEMSCAILDDDTAKCWGANELGELGTGDAVWRGGDLAGMGDSLPVIDLGPGRRAVTMAPSSYSACAVLDDASARCWGDASDLGLGTSTEGHGATPGSMGAGLPPVLLGVGRTALSMASAARATCALLDDHTVKCWGYNVGGDLGVGDGESRGDAPGEMGDALPAVDLGAGRTALAIAAGAFTVCAVLDTHELKCWGTNTNGQLGLGDTAARGDDPGELGDALPVVPLW
jgi:hypothetical protein